MLLTTLLLPLAVSASILEQRQSAGSKYVGTTKLEPVIRKTANRQLIKYGPFKLKAAGSGAMDSTLMGQSFMLNIKEGICNQKGEACTILAGRVSLMYTDGKQADPSNGIYIHHILSSDTSKRQSPWLSACGKPNSAGMSINGITGGTGFISAGEDSSDGGVMYTTEDGSQNSGYHIAAKDTFNVWAQIVNYNKVAKDVYLTYDLEWVPGIQGTDVKTMLLSATSCSSMIRMSESGPTNTTSGKFYFMEDGKIFRARGHLHDGGVQMDLFINDKFICASKATYGSRSAADDQVGGHSHGSVDADGSIKTISGMSNCWGSYPVKKGDYMTTVARYDLKKHPLRKTASGGKAADVMGLLTISFTANNK